MGISFQAFLIFGSLSLANLPGFNILVIKQIKYHKIIRLHQKAPPFGCTPASQNLDYFKALALPDQGKRSFSIVAV